MEDADFIEYMKAHREENRVWAKDFRKRYGIVEHKCDHLTPQERTENRSHYPGYAECSH